DRGARVDPPGEQNDQPPGRSLQERSSDLTRPDDEVPQAIKLLNDDVHLSVPRINHESCPRCDCQTSRHNRARAEHPFWSSREYKNLSPSPNCTSVSAGHEKG